MSNTKKKEIKCIWCLRGFLKICGHKAIEKEEVKVLTSLGKADEELPNFMTYKDDSVLKDPQSTGRHRAAKLYPLNPEAFCEWAGKDNIGGGAHPIQGCGLRSGSKIGFQQARHHGPDKNVLNNEEGNVHRICTACHNEWHAKNDADYVPGTVIGD